MADQHLLAEHCSGSVPPHPGLPLAHCRVTHHGLWLSSQPQHRCHPGRAGTQRTDSSTCPQIRPILTLRPLGLPTLQGQQPCPQTPPHSGRNSQSVCQPALTMLKGSSSNYFTNLLSTNIGGSANCLLPLFRAPFPPLAPGVWPPNPASRKGGSKWNMV